MKYHPQFALQSPLRCRPYSYKLTEPLLKLNNAINQRKEREVASSANIITSMVCATALTNEDVSCTNHFTTKLLYSETLTTAISSVSSTSYRFLMCHCVTSSASDLAALA